MVKIEEEKCVLKGSQLLNDPAWNKGLAFSLEERKEFGIEGFLPPVVLTQEIQIRRAMEQLNRKRDPLEQYIYLMGLCDRNISLFYRVLIENVEQLMPIVYTPIVGLACQKYGHIFRQPNGLYLNWKMKGNLQKIINQWPQEKVSAIVFTDGHRILGLGDLGCFGMGIPVGKLTLYTVCGGIDPTELLPVQLDVGTNTQSLLDDPLYTGLRIKRKSGEGEFDEFIAEFIGAVRNRWGENTLLQFEDFGNANALRLLQQWQDKCCTFNDDIQGTASVVLAGLLTSLKITETKKLKDHVIILLGAGSAGLGIANLIALSIAITEGCTIEEGRKNIWCCDSSGLIVKGRKRVSVAKSDFAHPHKELKDLTEIVADLKATVIIGVAAVPKMFTKQVVENISANTKTPVIFALSNPTSKAECTAEEAYIWSKGTCIFASGSPFAKVKYEGRTYKPGQGNNSYIFPGLALAVVAVKSKRVPHHLMVTAAEALVDCVSEDDLKEGCLYPPLQDIRKCSLEIAVKVAEELYERKLATVERPKNLRDYIISKMYTGKYPKLVKSML